MYFHVIFILLSIILTRCDGGKKMFLQDMSFDSPKNWDPPHLPCKNSRLIYPDMADVPLTLPLSRLNEVREIILPDFGTVYLDSGTLKLTTDAQEDEVCPYEDVTFIEDTEERWMDPKNWEEIGSDKSTGKLATPHYDRIPCVYDIAYFPPGRQYRVLLPEFRQSVKSIEYYNKSLSMDEWTEIVLTSDNFFDDYFDVGVTVTIDNKGNNCKEDDICFCHKDHTPDELCEDIVCPFPQCLNPIHPINHCCPICGGLLEMRYNNQNTKQLKNEIKKIISEYGNDEVDWYLGGAIRKLDKFIQLVLVDKNTYDGYSSKLAKYIYKNINKSFQEKITMKVAGIAWAGPNAPRGGLKETLGTFFLVFLFIVGLVIYYYPPGLLRSINPFRTTSDFARFDNRSREGSLFLGTSHLSLEKAFENPMYNKLERTMEEEKYEEKDLSISNDTEDDYAEPAAETSFYQ